MVTAKPHHRHQAAAIFRRRFSYAISRRIQELGKTESQVAKEAQVNQSTLNTWARGVSDPDARALPGVAAALELELYYVMWLIGYLPPEYSELDVCALQAAREMERWAAMAHQWFPDGIHGMPGNPLLDGFQP